MARGNPKTIADEARIEPTPQTLAKRRRDTLQVLFERRAIGVEELRAALEIRRVFHAVIAASMARVSRLDEPRGPRRVPEFIDAAWSGRYKPWANEMSARRKLGGPPILEVVIDAVVDELSCRQIDRARHWREGKAADYIRLGLERYAVRAGWRAAVAEAPPNIVKRAG